MTQISIKVSPSFEKVGKAFRDIRLGYAIQKGVEALALSVERESKKVTPVDTGRLRASIDTDVRLLEATIAPHTDYAVPVHEGHRTRSGSWVEGRPFMKTGLDISQLKAMGNKNPVYKEVKRYITAEVRKI